MRRNAGWQLTLIKSANINDWNKKKGFDSNDRDMNARKGQKSVQQDKNSIEIA